MAENNILVTIFKLCPNSWEDIRKFKFILSDFLPEDKLKRNLLYCSVEEQIPLEMSNVNIVTNIEMHRWTQKLVQAYGCREDLAEKIVNLWIEAFELKLEMPEITSKIDENYDISRKNASIFSIKESNLNEGRYIVEEKVFIRYMGACIGEVVTVPKGIEKIADNAFAGCNISKVILPEGLISIGKRAFENCQALKEVVLPNSLERIGWSAFQKSGIQHIEIPESVRKIKGCAFLACHSLKEITLPPRLMPKTSEYSLPSTSVVKSTEDMNGDYIVEEKVFIRYMGACIGEVVTVPKGIEKIADNAFAGCNISKVILPEGLISIGKRAFENCQALKEVVLPNSLERIGWSAFQKSGIQHIEIPESVRKIKGCAFLACHSLKEITLPPRLMPKTSEYSLPSTSVVKSTENMNEDYIVKAQKK